MKPLCDARVELRDRLAPAHVFGELAEDPGGGDEERGAERQLEAEVLARRESPSQPRN